MRKTTFALIESGLFFVGLFLVYLSGSFYTILYTSDVEFGSRNVLLNKYIAILGPALLFAIGVLLIVGHIKVTKKLPHLKSRLDSHVILSRIYLAIFSFCGILSIMFMLTIWYGLPFDVTDWGITAQMFGKMFVGVLPGILCGIVIISLLIATSGNFWMMIFKCAVIVAFTYLIYLGIVPQIMVFL